MFDEDPNEEYERKLWYDQDTGRIFETLSVGMGRLVDDKTNFRDVTGEEEYEQRWDNKQLAV